jgi:DNA recombination protein RmuC
MDLLIALAALSVGVLLGRLWLGARLAAVTAELEAERRLGAQREAYVQGATAAALDRVGGDLEARRRSVEALVAPVSESLAKVEAHVRALETAREGAYAGLSATVRALLDNQERLRADTAALVTALRTPQVRGRWGEVQLRRVVELAGMVEHCDFIEQPTLSGPDGRCRPDLVVRLPGGGSVVVDAKVPLAAYLDLTSGRPGAGLPAHARQLRSHVEALATKAYWEAMAASPDFVVLFVPGEPVLAAALESDPALLDDAAAARVLLASPVTLIALLKSVAYGWRQEAMTNNAREVCRLGRELHTRLGLLADRLGRVGRGLDTAVRSYNEAVGTLEGRVLVSARRLRDLQVASEELPGVDPVERLVRMVRPVEAGEAGPEAVRAAGEAGRLEPTG